MRAIRKFTIVKQDGRWYVVIPTILRSYFHCYDPDWYVFDTFDGAQKFVARKLTYSNWRAQLRAAA
jgi:hypothetical protein